MPTELSTQNNFETKNHLIEPRSHKFWGTVNKKDVASHVTKRIASKEG